ncbi:MAG: NAD(P)H-dependent oxidoreductase [Deltaproteobacteria bacterium]|jgi:chromate reductase|nr:NAD(P)H-dependent oxidoreductase [Deltaproteobacteria bacterium]MBW2537384.1 NAD(P)H-dependent oxidoreductase [Deltaproteobacteria bacterium]
MKPLRILGIAGSLREASLNRAALRAASSLAPEGSVIESFDLSTIPLYNGDLDVEGGPDPVRDFKGRIADADGLLIVTPEYNYSIPGVLKNALDWASRPAYQSVLAHKPVAFFGASMSPIGTARAQSQLKHVLLGTLSEVFPYPEVLVGKAQEKFDSRGVLTDEQTGKYIRGLLDGYVEWLRRRG